MIAILASLAACGGKEKPGRAKAQYIQQADAICADVNSKLTSAGTNTDKATLEKIRDIWADAYQRLNALPIPGESQEQGQLFIAAIHNVALTAEAAVQASLLDDQQKVTKSLADGEAALDQATEAAEDYGLETCNQL